MKYVDFAVEEILRLCKIPSPSGFTREIENQVFNELTSFGFQTTYSNKRSILSLLGGEGHTLVLAAHLDTLGAMVRSLKPNGRLRFTKIGGFPENFIEGENCTIHTREGRTFSGTFQLLKPSVHVNKKAAEEKRDDENVEIVVDEKVRDKKDLISLGISPGDFVSFDPKTVLTQSGFIKSRHLDDKASAGILIALAKLLKEEKITPARKVYLLFTTFEEVGHGASSGLPEDAEEIVSVDMGAVGDDLETDEYKVSICAKDSGGPYDFNVTNKLIELAKKEKLNYAVDIYPFYGSDAEAALYAGFDVRHGLIGPGVSASHGYERTHREGVENTLKLLKEYVNSPVVSALS
ncbi:M42 family metallopeptidase [candidate division WOR-3 bacterium]|nr:M42 family metallopeptidase [candidate division WOR-3 bacterium]